MAKKSMIAREVKREKLVKEICELNGRNSKQLSVMKHNPMEERFRASLKLAKLPRNSSAVRLAQPLPTDWASACLLSQAQDQSDCAAGTWLCWPNPRLSQV